MLKEEWKETEIPGYFISNLGRLKGRSGKIIKSYLNKRMGYHMVCLKPFGRKGKAKCIKISRLVAKAFIPNQKNLPCINHIDGNKQNNIVTNLEWCTYSENTIHAYKHNLVTIHRGEDHPSSKLTNKQVEWIRKNYIPRDKQFGTRGLGRKFNVSHDTIIEILKHNTYK